MKNNFVNGLTQAKGDGIEFYLSLILPMTQDLELSPTTDAAVLCLALCPQGWVLGWVGLNHPTALSSWSEFGPPTACPVDVWVQAIELTLRDHLGLSPRFELVWTDLTDTEVPTWWPTGRRTYKPWQSMAQAQGLIWLGGRRLTQAADLQGLWTLVHATMEAPVVHRRVDWLQSLIASPARMCLISSVLCLFAHALLLGALHPWLEA